MAAVIGTASGGARAFASSSSHDLAYMHEMLHWASAARLPIVMAEVNRALGPGWNIWTDQTDSLAPRDTGWIQLYCEDGQEALDSTLLASRLAEALNLPVMVVLDAFFLSHTLEPVDIPDQEQLDAVRFRAVTIRLIFTIEIKYFCVKMGVAVFLTHKKLGIEQKALARPIRIATTLIVQHEWTLWSPYFLPSH